MDRRSIDRRLAEIAGSQGGAFSREQALAAGFTRDMIRGRLAAGAWTVPLPRTYCPAAVRHNKVTLNHAALLYAGEEALLSHLTAATLWKLKVPPSHLVWLVTHHDQTVTKQAGIAPKRTRRMPRGQTIDGLRVTPLPRTFLDLAQVLDRRPLLVAMLDAVDRGRSRWSGSSPMPREWEAGGTRAAPRCGRRAESGVRIGSRGRGAQTVRFGGAGVRAPGRDSR